MTSDPFRCFSSSFRGRLQTGATRGAQFTAESSAKAALTATEAALAAPATHAEVTAEAAGIDDLAEEGPRVDVGRIAEAALRAASVTLDQAAGTAAATLNLTAALTALDAALNTTLHTALGANVTALNATLDAALNATLDAALNTALDADISATALDAAALTDVATLNAARASLALVAKDAELAVRSKDRSWCRDRSAVKAVEGGSRSGVAALDVASPLNVAARIPSGIGTRIRSGVGTRVPSGILARIGSRVLAGIVTDVA